MPAQAAPDDHRDQDGHEDVELARAAAGAGEGGRGEDDAMRVLALDTDVEQVHPEADRPRRARRGRASTSWLRMLTMLRPLGGWRITFQKSLTDVAGDHDDDAGDQHGDDDRDQRREHGQDDLPQDRRGGHASSLPPVMAAAELLRRHGAAGRTRRPARPRRITWIVSERPISSSRSAEIEQHRQPEPPGTLDVVPDRRPGHRRRRPGWGARRSAGCGSLLISRPTMSFCWLPPESARAVVSIAGVRTSYSSTIRWCPPWTPCGRPGRHGRRACGSGGPGSGSPTAARRAAGRGGAGPRGCSRCRPRGVRGCASR